jgi:hypothetical protein
LETYLFTFSVRYPEHEGHEANYEAKRGVVVVLLVWYSSIPYQLCISIELSEKTLMCLRPAFGHLRMVYIHCCCSLTRLSHRRIATLQFHV